jgi:TonB family protein
MAVSITKDGAVSTVRIVEGAGAPFDDLAKSAMLRFLFDPGRGGDGRPLACEITYRYTFAASR